MRRRGGAGVRSGGVARMQSRAVASGLASVCARRCARTAAAFLRRWNTFSGDTAAASAAACAWQRDAARRAVRCQCLGSEAGRRSQRDAPRTAFSLPGERSSCRSGDSGSGAALAAVAAAGGASAGTFAAVALRPRRGGMAPRGGVPR
jgi:hypothetical protein